MMFSPQHYGLFLGLDHIAQARSHATREPFQAAFEASKRPIMGWAASVQNKALRYRFAEDQSAGLDAVMALGRDFTGDLPVNAPYLLAVAETIMTAHAFEMVRDHPMNRDVLKTQFLSTFGSRVSLLADVSHELSYVESLWRGLLMLAAGVVLEHETIFEEGVTIFHHAVKYDINPRGYIEPVLGGTPGSMERSVQAVSALVLMAEAAAQANVKLWHYEVRGVSVMTAAMYPVYYFYVTDKWTWETISPDEVQTIFRRHGGYLEMVNRRAQPRDFKPVLDDLRPIYDPWAGGWTTLTHGVPVKRRGLFG
jgi:hypothetical protein